MPNEKLGAAVIYKFPEEFDGTYTDHGVQITDSNFNDLEKIDELILLFAEEYEKYCARS